MEPWFVVTSKFFDSLQKPFSRSVFFSLAFSFILSKQIFAAIFSSFSLSLSCFPWCRIRLVLVHNFQFCWKWDWAVRAHWIIETFFIRLLTFSTSSSSAKTSFAALSLYLVGLLFLFHQIVFILSSSLNIKSKYFAWQLYNVRTQNGIRSTSYTFIALKRRSKTNHRP